MSREDAAAVRDVERRVAVLVALGEDQGAAADDAVEVIDVAGDEALEQIERSLVAERVDRRPGLGARAQLLHADRRCLRARLEDPRRGHRVEIAIEGSVVQDVDELRHRDAAGAGPDPHRELVAEVARCRLAHPADAQMLANQGSGLDVEIIEGDDAVDGFLAGEVRDTLEEGGPVDVARHVERLIDGLVWPQRVAQAIVGEEQDTAAEVLGLAHEVVTLLVGRDQQHGQLAFRRHPWMLHQ